MSKGVIMSKIDELYKDNINELTKKDLELIDHAVKLMQTTDDINIRKHIAELKQVRQCVERGTENSLKVAKNIIDKIKEELEN